MSRGRQMVSKMWQDGKMCSEASGRRVGRQRHICSLYATQSPKSLFVFRFSKLACLLLILSLDAYWGTTSAPLQSSFTLQ